MSNQIISALEVKVAKRTKMADAKCVRRIPSNAKRLRKTDQKLRNHLKLDFQINFSI